MSSTEITVCSNMSNMNTDKKTWAKVVDPKGSDSHSTVSPYKDLVQDLEELFPDLSIQNSVSAKYISDDIRLTDSDGEVCLYHYVDCDDNSSDDIKNMRGVIREGDTIVCKTFGYTPEISCFEVDEIKKRIHSFNQSTVYAAEEGATVRIWYDKKNGKWRDPSTHRKINAYQSRWGNPKTKTFGEMFIDALYWESYEGELKGKFDFNDELYSQFCDTLDKSKTYAFLVRNSDSNRIVCEAPNHPQAYFIGSFDNTTHLLVEGNDSGFPYPEVLNFETVDDMIEYVRINTDCRKTQGVIVYLPDQTQLKIMNDTYLDFFAVRGNEPSVKFRYLQVRHDNDMVTKLCALYSDYIPAFELYDAILDRITIKIYNAYVERFIKHNYVSLPQQEYFILQICHGWHLQNKIKNKVNPKKVMEIIDDQSPTTLNKLIRTYTNNKQSN